AGQPFAVTVAAVDVFGQAAAGYAGTVTFSTTDQGKGVVLPADYTFTADDGGAHTFTDTGRGETHLVTQGGPDLTSDDLDGGFGAIVSVTVEAGARQKK